MWENTQITNYMCWKFSLVFAHLYSSMVKTNILLTDSLLCFDLGTRVFVHKSIHDTFLRRVVDRTKRIRVGDPMDPDTHMGAIISESHMNRIMEYVRIGQEEGDNQAVVDRGRKLPL